MFTCLTSCRKDILVPDTNFKNLFGRWTWIESSGGFSGHTINPNTENYSLTAEYKSNGVYKKFKDGKKITKQTFSFQESESIYSVNEEYLIEYSEGRLSKKLVIPHSFEFIGPDTLILKDECYDCYIHIYVKEK